MPPELKNDMDKEKFEKSRQYGLDKNMFGLVQAQFDLIISVVSFFLLFLKEVLKLNFYWTHF